MAIAVRLRGFSAIPGVIPPSQTLPPKGKGLDSTEILRNQLADFFPLLWERARVREFYA